MEGGREEWRERKWIYIFFFLFFLSFFLSTHSHTTFFLLLSFSLSYFLSSCLSSSTILSFFIACSFKKKEEQKNALSAEHSLIFLGDPDKVSSRAAKEYDEQLYQENKFHREILDEIIEKFTGNEALINGNSIFNYLVCWNFKRTSSKISSSAFKNANQSQRWAEEINIQEFEISH